MCGDNIASKSCLEENLKERIKWEYSEPVSHIFHSGSEPILYNVILEGMIPIIMPGALTASK